MFTRSFSLLKSDFIVLSLDFSTLVMKVICVFMLLETFCIIVVSSSTITTLPFSIDMVSFVELVPFI